MVKCTKEEAIQRLISDYYQSLEEEDINYNMGLADATISAINRIIDISIDPPGLE